MKNLQIVKKELFVFCSVFLYLFMFIDFEVIKLLFSILIYIIYIFSKYLDYSNIFHLFCQTVLTLFLNFYFYESPDLFSVTLSIFLIIIFLLDSEDSLINFSFSHSQKNNFFIIASLFVVGIFLQNIYLDYETIDWDQNSYLVMSLDIGRGNLPYENQWEDKQPFFYYLYYFFIKLSNYKLAFFKLTNDLIVFTISILIYFISSDLNKENRFYSIASPFVFLSLMSIPWGTVDYSELYSLLFIGFSFLVMNKFTKNSSVFISGLLFSLSTLINIGSSIFILGFLLMLHLQKKNYFLFFIGLTMGHLFFVLLYFFNGLIEIYIATIFTIPFGYSTSSLFDLGTLTSFLYSFFQYNYFLYLLLTTLIFFRFHHTFFGYKYFLVMKEKTLILNMFTAISILFFALASKGYNHHLIYFLFFISIIFPSKNRVSSGITILVFNFVFVFYQIFQFSPNVINNITNASKINDEYPLYEMSQIIDSYFEDDYDILALDHHLVLFYLNKPNFSYIVHPTNHFEPWIEEVLIDMDLIEQNNVVNLINKKPDVLICSHISIKFDLIYNKNFNCEISDYYPEYKKLNFIDIEENRKREYYYDPYQDISVFIKEK